MPAHAQHAACGAGGDGPLFEHAVGRACVCGVGEKVSANTTSPARVLPSLLPLTHKRALARSIQRQRCDDGSRVAALD